MKTILLFTLAAALCGCTSKGYRHTLCYSGACYSIDRPHVHAPGGAVVTNATELP